MTISSQTNRWVYNGDGSTVAFPYTNKIFAASDLAVTVGGVAQVLNTDYTLAGVGVDAGGTVTFVAAPASGTGNVILVRDVPATQGTDIPLGGAFPASLVEDGLDKVTVLVQQVADKIVRSLVQPNADPAAIAELPGVASRASKFLAFDASGDPIASSGPVGETPVSAFMETMLGDANAADARATLGLGIGTDVQADLDVPSQAEAETGTATIERVWTAERISQAIGALAITPLPRGYIDGLLLANNGTDANNDIDIGIGECRNDTNDGNLMLTSLLTKQLDAAFAEGTNLGGLDSGTKANDTWYHIFAIAKADGTVDALFSTSALTPTMPTGFTKKRRIGAVRTNGSGSIRGFLQNGDVFQWKSSPGADFSASTGTSQNLITVSAPIGLKVPAFGGMSYQGDLVDRSRYVVFHDPDLTDEAAGSNNFTHYSAIVNDVADGGQWHVMTNISAQIAVRSDSNYSVTIVTRGWVDPRGRNAV